MFTKTDLFAQVFSIFYMEREQESRNTPHRCYVPKHPGFEMILKIREEHSKSANVLALRSKKGFKRKKKKLYDVIVSVPIYAMYLMAGDVIPCGLEQF